MYKSLYYEAGGKFNMSLKRKGFLEDHKKVAGDKLVTRMSFLKEKGLDAVAIKRDSFIKKIKADIRKANYRMACIAAQEKLNADKVQTKTEKLAAKKNTPDKPSAKIAKEGALAKKEKNEKKKAPLPSSDEQE
jgi:hypothetical protein